MKYILDTNEKGKSQIWANVIQPIQQSLASKKITKLSIAIAFGTLSKNSGRVAEFWEAVIKAKVPTDFYFRLDSGLAVDIEMLELTKDAEHICWFPIPEGFHAKMLWAEPLGIYIGSANMTDKAWSTNFEAGVWLTEVSSIDDLQGYFDKLKDAAYTRDKQDLFQRYRQYGETVATFQDDTARKEDIFKDLFPKLKDTQHLPNTSPFVKDIEKIYDIFFNDIYPKIKKSWSLLPKEWQDRPINYIADQLLLAVEHEKYSTLDMAIKHITDCRFYPDGFGQTFEGYTKNYEIIQNVKMGGTIKDKLYDFLRNIHSVTSDHFTEIDELVRDLSTHKSFQGKTVTDVIRYLAQEDGLSISDKYYTVISTADWKIKRLGEGRIGEIIGISQVVYKGELCPILNGGVRKRLTLLGYDIPVSWVR